ncbi:hypothetical protein E4T44_01595 [Aureobasidium sp. EXF-8845]|nr:hypothetical protein E4T44_01595 [Aureobasidium sp. EXF-8845]KAI4857136.1 hypothetical protein E4T45_01381 [Aureobasidium sp. EXF-8846]
MSSPSTGRRRSSLSAAFDHFRDRCRKTRIDSLLSPPELDSGTSNDEGGDLSSSSLEGVPLTSGSSDQSLGINVDMKVKEEEDAGKDEVKEEDKQSHRDSKLPQFIFDDDGFGDLESAAEQSSFTSPDEDKRLLSALAVFSAEVTEAEYFGRYFFLSRQRNTGKQPLQEESISPGECVSIGVGSNSVSGSFTRLLHSDASGSTWDFEVGVPLHRTVANGNLRREWTRQVQTEPQTQEQSGVQSTHASLDQLVQDTVSMEENGDEDDSGEEDDVPVMRTVDGNTATTSPPYHPLLTTASHGAFSDQEPFYYSHTPPRVLSFFKHTLSISKTQPFSTLSSRSEIAMFHGAVSQKLHTAINTGEIKPCRIGVKERVRRLSGAGARRVGEQGREIGEAVVASGSVGVGWGDMGTRAEEAMRRRSAGVCFGVATFALAVAVMQLYWNRPGAQRQNAPVGDNA